MASQTIKGLLGQPVITLDAGRRVGAIQEILYSACENRVAAIILSKPPVAGTAKAVSFEHVALFGVDVTFIDSDRWIGPLGALPAPPDCVQAATNVIHTQVLTTAGRRIGEVGDVILDEKGTILGYQISHNIFRDALRGKPFVPVSAVTAVGTDALLVDAPALNNLPPQSAPLPEPAEEPQSEPVESSPPDEQASEPGDPA